MTQTEAQYRYGKRRTLANRLRREGLDTAAIGIERNIVKTDDLFNRKDNNK